MVVGLAGGLAGAAFVGTLNLLQRLLWPTHWATPAHLFVLVAVGGAVGLLTRLLGNPGDVELLVDNIHVLGGNEDLRDLKSLLPVSLLCISAGGAMGPEAPLVQTTGSLGTRLARRRGMGVADTRVLTITGMAAGFTVLFGAPLGSAVFALEILHRRGLEYYEALLPAIVGSLCGYGVYAAVAGLGFQHVWHFPATPVNVGVTKTPVGSALVVSEMTGLRLLPTTVVASVVALLITSPVALIDSQRERERAYDPAG